LSWRRSISAAKTIRRQIEQFGCSVQIGFRANNIHVSHVCREPGEASVQIHTLPIPPSEPLHSEGMPQVVWAWTDPTLFWFEPGFGKQTTECVMGSLDRQLALIDAHKESHIGGGRCVLPTLDQVQVQLT
jgi:hypothetical protein